MDGFSFCLQVTSSELVQEIHQVLMDKEETCHRTCFSLQLDGTILDNFTELKNIENLKEGSLLKVIEGSFQLRLFAFSTSSSLVEEQYTVREVRIHVRHINELIHACDPLDLYNGTNGYSLCIVNDILNGSSSSSERRKGHETNTVDFNVPEYLQPNQNEISLSPLFATNTKLKVKLRCSTFLHRSVDSSRSNA